MILISHMCPSELIWTLHPECPPTKKALAWGLVGRTTCVNTHPPATGSRSPLAGQRGSELRSRSARPLSGWTIRRSVSSRSAVASIVKLSSFWIGTMSRTVLSGAGAECATWGRSEGARDARPETRPRARGGSGVTAIDFQTDPATARRYRVVSLVTHADISDIVWADDETGCYAVRGRDAKGNRIVVEQSGPIRIVAVRR